MYQCIEAHWPEFRERAEEAGGLPKFVVREFEEYLRCGRLEAGCLHLECRSCDHSQLVAFSCKRRGFCPSCLGRSMVDTAVHLEQNVLPAVPIRHWICSLPWGLRTLCGYDCALCAEVVSAFVLELSRSLKRRAKRRFGLASVADAHTGAVAAIQRTASALRLNVHAHVLALDGVYIREKENGPLVLDSCIRCGGPMRWVEAATTPEAIARLMAKHGFAPRAPPTRQPPLALQLELPFTAVAR